jgi:hypothetical protein
MANYHPTPRRTTSEPEDGKMTEPSPLAADLLGPGVAAIAAYTGEPERRQRHLIRHHNFPHFKRGGLIYSKRSWADAYYSGETVAVNGKSEK